MGFQVVHHRFVDRQGRVAETGPRPGEKMNRGRLMDGGHVRDAGQPGRLSGGPVRTPGMGMDQIDFCFHG